MPQAVAIPLVMVLFAGVWAALGCFLGIRLGERRLLRRMSELPGSPRTISLDNTVARAAGDPLAERRSWDAPDWTRRSAE